MRRALLTLCLISLALPAAGGCNNRQLETGYTYTPLGDSPNRRRGYYADPFSPEARAAQNERQADLEARRPVPGQ
jgi:hypothetical protein